MALDTALTSFERLDLTPGEGVRSILCADKGTSGAAGTGLVLTGSATIPCQTEIGFIPRLIYIETAGNFCFKTMDGNSHKLPVADKTTLQGIFVMEIYEASHATLPTTCGGVHCFG